MVSPYQPLDYTGNKEFYVPYVTRNRDPLPPQAASADFRNPSTGRLYPLSQIWRNSVTNDIWMLVDISSNLGNWKKITGGTVSPLLTVTGNDGVPNDADANGDITFLGAVVANSTNSTLGVVKPLYIKFNAANVEDWQIQVGAAIAATDITKTGLLAANSAQFTVDANGFLSLKGSSVNPPVLGLVSDNPLTATADASGNITLHGLTVANATRAKPLFVNRPSANALDCEIQLSIANTTNNNPNFAGISYFDSAEFTVNSSGFVSLVNPNVPTTPTVAVNLGLTLAAGVLTLCAQDGTALSSTNKGYVAMPDKTNPGLTDVIEITANVTLQDSTSGGSTVNNNQFGLESGGVPNWPAIMFIYVSVDDAGANPAIFISRYPHYRKMPAAGSVFGNSTATANLESDFLAWTNITPGNYDGNPCVNIGSFRMQKNNGTNDWTFQTLENYDGINRYNEERLHSTFFNQDGAATNTCFIPNGGTPATGGLVPFQYKVNRAGIVHCETYTLAPFNGAGAGAVLALFSLPFIPNNTAGGNGTGQFRNSSGTIALNPYLTGNQYFGFTRCDNGADLNWADFTTATTMSLSFAIDYTLPNPPV